MLFVFDSVKWNDEFSFQSRTFVFVFVKFMYVSFLFKVCFWPEVTPIFLHIKWMYVTLVEEQESLALPICIHGTMYQYCISMLIYMYIIVCICIFPVYNICFNGCFWFP